MEQLKLFSILDSIDGQKLFIIWCDKTAQSLILIYFIRSIL